MMKKLSLAALFASTALIPAAFAQTNPNSVDIAAIEDNKVCGELVSYVDENDTDATGMTAERAGTIAEGADPIICRDAFRLATGVTINGDATAEIEATAGIEVSVPEPQVNVDQAAAQVMVEQPKPNVDVTPGRPVVTVTQAEPVVIVETTPPTVTIDMPKPQILVEMPDPTVDVAMAQPHVTVEQPEPTVSVTQGEVKLEIGDKEVSQNQGEANVNVNQADATVRVDAAEGSNVNVAEVQPEVRYNATKPRIEMSEVGEPKIEFKQSGEASVRFRQMNADETRADATERDGQGAPNAQFAARQNEDQATAENTQATVLGQDENRQEPAIASNTAARDTSAGAADQQAMQSFRIDELIDRSVIGANGDAIGDVENFVARDGETYAVVGVGGLLGLGEKQVAIPLSDIAFRGDQLVSPSLTEEAVEGLAELDDGTYRPLETNQNIEVMIQ